MLLWRLAILISCVPSFSFISDGRIAKASHSSYLRPPLSPNPSCLPLSHSSHSFLSPVFPTLLLHHTHEATILENKTKETNSLLWPSFTSFFSGTRASVLSSRKLQQSPPGARDPTDPRASWKRYVFDFLSMLQTRETPPKSNQLGRVFLIYLFLNRCSGGQQGGTNLSIFLPFLLILHSFVIVLFRISSSGNTAPTSVPNWAWPRKYSAGQLPPVFLLSPPSFSTMTMGCNRASTGRYLRICQVLAAHFRV